MIAYCQLRLVETTKNDVIEVVKRNITNMFEEVDDPFADDFDQQRLLPEETPTHQANQHSIVRQAAQRGVQQRGNQFRLKDKQFMVYLRKFPLHSQKPNEPGVQSLNSARNSNDIPSTKNLKTPPPTQSQQPPAAQ